ncbi:MAG TPA: hypothetical protein VER33_14390 [Polyangiaceae bacterium]|nr:hypothetical protein [Polyangiaceae bacterium]
MSWLRKSFAVLGVATIGGLVLPGCEKNESIVFILGAMSLDRTECVARPEADAVLLEGGVLDLAITGSYRAALLVASQLTERGSRESLRTETARLNLQGAEVHLHDSGGRPLALQDNPYSTLGSGFVNPAGGTEPGFGSIFVDIIPSGVPVPLGTVTASVRVFGTTLGGQNIESNELKFPIQVCHGCLIQYSVGAIDDTLPPGEQRCDKFVAAEETEVIVGCFPGQDMPVSCSLCAASNDACLDPCQNCAARRAFGCPEPPPAHCPPP